MSMSYEEARAEEFYEKHGYYAGEQRTYDVPELIEYEINLKDEYAVDDCTYLCVGCELYFEEDDIIIYADGIVFLDTDENLGVEKGDYMTNEFIEKYTVEGSLKALYKRIEDFANDNIESLKNYEIELD